MSKTILTFSNEEVQSALFHSYVTAKERERFFNSLAPYWGQRDELELDTDYRQPIVYTALCDGNNRVFVYKRSGGGEKRLDAQMSIGIGGHVDIGDEGNTNWETIQNSFRRELKEEVPSLGDFNPANLRFEGILLSDETDVDKVHMAVLMQYFVDDLDNIEFDEGVSIGAMELSNLRNLADAYPDLFESWTKQFLRVI